MAQEIVIALRELLFKKVFYYKQYEVTDEDVSTLFGEIVELNVDGKADKLVTGVENNFMCFDDTGNIKDSLKNSGSFSAAGHTHDSRYLRLDADNLYDSVNNTFTFQVLDGVPFVIDNTSGDILAAVEHLNADLLDGKHASAFAALKHTHDERYIRSDTGVTVTNLLTFQRTTAAPFAIAVTSQGQLVTGLNADQLDGNHASDFATAAHTHDTRYLRLDAGNTYDSDTNTFNWQVVDGVPFVIDNTGGDPLPVITWLNADMLDDYEASDFALAAHTHSEYTNKVPAAVVDNFCSFLEDGDIQDSGYSATDFAAAGHNHDAEYLKLPAAGSGGGLSLLVYDGSEPLTSSITEAMLVTSNSSVGGTTTPSGTVQVDINGVTFYLLTAAAA